MAVGLSYGGVESRRMDFGRRADRRWFRGERQEPVTVLEDPAETGAT
jgi:hypothetical protein